MTKEIFNWQDNTEGTSWDAYLCTRLGTGSLCVGHSLSKGELAIHYNESLAGIYIHEHLMILNGGITQFDHQVGRTGEKFEKLYEKIAPIKENSPCIIRKNLRKIMKTIPDETAKKLLGEVSKKEWKKIEPTKLEKKLERTCREIKGEPYPFNF